MQRSTIMKSGAIVAVLFGLPLLLAPDALLALYRSTGLNAPGIYNSMLYGACLVSIGVSNWLASDGTWAEARPVLVGTLVLNVLGLLVALQRQLTDQAPLAAWANVVIFGVFSVVYAGLLRRAAVPEPVRA
jgi:hypothetical protein